MNRTRLFIYKEPTIGNNKFEVKYTTNGELYDDDWSLNGATVTQYGILPAPDNAVRDFAITQDLGITGAGTFRIAVEIGEGPTPQGFYEIQIGNTHATISTAGRHIIDFVVTTPDPVLGYKLAISASGGSYLGGATLNDLGLRSIYILGAETEAYEEVDLYDNVDIPITYNVADVRDISKKDSNWSLTIDLPNTPNNAQIFDCIHEISDYKSNFELLKQYKAFVEVDNNRTFEGYFKLTKVVINNDKEISYEGNLYSNVIEFVKRLGTQTLRGNDNPIDDIDFSEYNVSNLDVATLKKLTTIENTYLVDPNDVKKGKGLFLSMIDKYNWGNRQLHNSIYGKGQPIYVNELTPCLWYKEIFDKIFENAGFSYVSDFITNSPNNSTTFDFTSIAYPFTGFNFPVKNDAHIISTQVGTSGTYNDRTLYKFNNGTEIYQGIYEDSATFYDDVNNISFDSLPVSSLVSSNPMTWNVPETGVYHIKLDIPISLSFQLGSKNTFNILYYTATLNSRNNSVSDINFKHWWVRLRLIRYDYNAGVERTLSVKMFDEEYQGTYDFVNGVCDIADDVWNGESNVSLNAGDSLYFKIDFHLPQYNVWGGNVNLYDNNDEYWHFLYLTLGKSEILNEQLNATLTSNLVIGGGIEANNILNENTRKIDLINSIIKKFNLYIEDVTNKKDNNGVYYRDYQTHEDDPSITNLRRGEPILKIEPRKMYYDISTQVKDWTDRVDVDSIYFSRIDEYLYKQIIINDEFDNDRYVENYNGSNFRSGEYGEKIYSSQFNTDPDEKLEIGTIFGQTMCGPVNNDYTLLPKFRSSFIQAPFLQKINDSGEIEKEINWNERMLFAYNTNIRDDGTLRYPDWLLTSDSEGYYLFNAGNPTINQPAAQGDGGNSLMGNWIGLDTFNYPYGEDNADLNFEGCEYYYQNLNGTWADYRNCYYTFYKDMIEEYNSVSARMMICNMYLKPSDIRDLKLSDTIIINSVAYHINKIKEWESGSTPCQVELIKIIDSNSDINTPIQKRIGTLMVKKPTITTPKQVLEKLDDTRHSINEQFLELNKSIESGNVSITELKKMISDIDYRLKKLESGK